MAGQTKKARIAAANGSGRNTKEIQRQNATRATSLTAQIVENGANLAVPDEVRLVAAKLYGQGFPRRTVAQALVDYLVPNSKARTKEQKLAGARAKLKRWEHSKEFRDLIYENAVIGLDMQVPNILKGLGRAAGRGRVDAAKL